MKIQAAILCDYAKARDWLVNMIGGAISRLTLSPIPGPMMIHLVLVIEFAQKEVQTPHELSVQIYRDSTTELIGALTATVDTHRNACASG